MTNPILRINGQPFATKANAKGARTRLSLEHTHYIAQLGGGWALFEKQSDARVTLQPGDYIATEGLTINDNNAVIQAMRSAGFELIGDLDKRQFSNIGIDRRSRIVGGVFGMSKRRQLTLAQILSATNAGGVLTVQDSKGWIENTGTCPVPEGALIDIRHRDGDEYFSLKALIDEECEDFSNDGDHPGDITHYRLVQGSNTNPQQEQPAMHITDLLFQARKERDEAQQRYERVLADHRATYPWLVVEEREQQPTEDMTDPSNWRAGDLITSLEQRVDITAGKQYIFASVDGDGDYEIAADDAGDERYLNKGKAIWHSRP